MRNPNYALSNNFDRNYFIGNYDDLHGSKTILLRLTSAFHAVKRNLTHVSGCKCYSITGGTSYIELTVKLHLATPELILSLEGYQKARQT